MAARNSRKACPEDVDESCRKLPETWFGTSWAVAPKKLVREHLG